jgi:HEAT repeat protein
VAALLDAMKRRENFEVVPPFAHNVRPQSCRALGKIGPEAHSAIRALMEALHDGVPGVRYNAVYALGQIGADARSTLPELRQSLNDENPDVRDRPPSQSLC